jgi:hypothetical protein
LWKEFREIASSLCHSKIWSVKHAPKIAN